MLPSNGSTFNLNIERYFLRLVFLQVKIKIRVLASKRLGLQTKKKTICADPDIHNG